MALAVSLIGGSCSDAGSRDSAGDSNTAATAGVAGFAGGDAITGGAEHGVAGAATGGISSNVAGVSGTAGAPGIAGTPGTAGTSGGASGASGSGGSVSTSGGSSSGGSVSTSGGSSSGGSVSTSGGSSSGGAAQGGEATAGSSSSMITVSYSTDSTTVLANPERGFYHHCETHADSHDALSAEDLASYRSEEAVTLVLRMFYLEAFRESEISADYLDAIAADLDTVRAAGLKAILRFAYTDSSTAPYGDASRARVVGHIQQLAPILELNADVVLTVQVGFVGAWGEWYYTDYFGDQGSISASQWDDREAVVDAWLAALPATRTIQLRTPAFKQHFFGSAPLSGDEAFTTTGKARVGHHNDCFLASADDMGTYGDVSADKAYLATENLYVPQGGETCAVSEFSDWTHAASDLASLHYTYLNRDYNPEVLETWGDSLDVARRLLGYRLSLVSGTYPATAVPGGTIALSLVLRNDGWAPPMNPRSFDILLRHEMTSVTYRARLAVDPRRFAPGETQVISGTLCVPPAIAEGPCRLMLALPDPEPALSTQAAYAIRLANVGLWDGATGYHELQHVIDIRGSALSNACESGSVALEAEPSQ